MAAAASSTSTLSLVWHSFEQRLGDKYAKLYTEHSTKDFEFSFVASSSLYAHSMIVKTFFSKLSPIWVRKFHFDNPEIDMLDMVCVLDFMYMGRTDIEAERLKIVKTAAETVGFGEMVTDIDYLIVDYLLKNRNDQ